MKDADFEDKGENPKGVFNFEVENFRIGFWDVKVEVQLYSGRNTYHIIGHNVDKNEYKFVNVDDICPDNILDWLKETSGWEK
jgi:hypothetical protein